MAKNEQTMQSKKLAKAKPGPPTQRFLDIAEIREDAVILKDGTLRAVIMVSSINFALKSVDEQQAMIQSYMQFLNGLEYPIQIVVQSRKMDIDSYIAELNKQEAEIPNELLKVQIRDYRSFIQELVELGEIMQKRFYVVVPYDPATDKTKNFFSKLSEAISPASVVKLSQKNFKERKQSLQQRVGIIQGGLTGMGLKNAVLDTQGLIELYYTVYNPDVYDQQPMKDVNKLKVEEGF
ncbi:MAG: TraC family protein [Candidatus Uhrbacteria bacterium]|nr:TraC family protein [Candidatus Uhrbacteria bacterium]